MLDEETCGAMVCGVAIANAMLIVDTQIGWLSILCKPLCHASHSVTLCLNIDIA